MCEQENHPLLDSLQKPKCYSSFFISLEDCPNQEHPLQGTTYDIEAYEGIPNMSCMLTEVQ